MYDKKNFRQTINFHFTEKVEFKKWLLMYFYERCNKQDNIIDIIKMLKRILEI